MPLNVLVVDDSAAIRKILIRILRQSEINIGEVYEAGDGVDALQSLKQHAVGLILSDINMPNMDGLQLLNQLRADLMYRNVPVFMITTEGSQTKVMEAVSLGATGYLRKPFTPEQIQEKLAGLA